MSGGDHRRIEVADLIAPERVIVGLAATDKTQVLNELAKVAASATGIGSQEIYQALAARERLGSTGVGGGIAMPHAQLPGLAGFWGLFARLDRNIDFEAVDEAPVDLVFVILIPASAPEHVAALSCAARRLRDRAVAAQIREASTPAEVYALLAGQSPAS
jgi:PTS system nitrogen regulatory IIA component